MSSSIDTESLESLASRCSNRGRWGRRGPPNALAFLTTGRVALAAAQVRRGIALSLAACDRGPDRITRIATPSPAPTGVCGRGVLLDLPRAERLAGLEPGEAIAPARLDLCAESLGFAIEPGDLVLVRTGGGRGTEPPPGLGLACAGWLHRREITLIATDSAATEAASNGVTERGEGPLYRVAFHHTGVLFGSDFELDALAAACAEDGNYVFLLVCPPLRRSGPNETDPLAIR